MKRAIKFRGKRPDGSWNYGRGILFKGDGSVSIHGAKVSPKTVGQFTGLKDMGGRDVYEGDIVRFSYLQMGLFSNKTLTLTGEVTADEYCNTVINVGGNEYHICNVDNGTVIGNVHDNPDLLKGGTR